MKDKETSLKQSGLPRTFFWLIIASSIALAGCGDSKEKKASQTLAKVNGDEITVHQVNAELARMGVGKEQQEQAAKQVLNALIDRQLMERAALDAKLDRNPNVLQAIERAKSQILAQAYIESKAASISKPAEAEISDYFRQHPELFGQRKAFSMQEIALPAGLYTDELKTMLDSAKSLDEVAAWLSQRGILFTRTPAERTSTDLPPDFVKQLLALPAGELLVVRAPNRIMIAEIKGIKDAPISEAQAKPLIERFLLNKKRMETGVTELKNLRASAKIEYMGEGAQAAENAMAESKALPVEKPAEAPAAGDKSHIDRGVAGLK